MQSIGTNGLPAAGHEDVQVLASIELSRKRWRVAAQLPAEDKVRLIDLAGGDAAALLKRLGEWAEKTARQLNRVARIWVCYEAGRDGFWLGRFLEAHGVKVTVIDPASLQVDRRARRAKTDRIDAESMLRALRRYSWGEPKVFAVVQPPAPEDEDTRCLSREREALIKERTRTINTIKALLTVQGVAVAGVGRRGWLERMTDACTGDGRPLGLHLRRRLGRLDQRLAQIATQITEVDAELAAVDHQRAAMLPKGQTTIAARLCRLAAIGPVSAMILEEEAFHRTFANRRDVAAYAGLTSSPFQSGDSNRDQGISKAGNPRLRRILIELAWLWLRYQPDSPLTQWFQSRVGNARGRVRRIAITAVARRLMIALWHYVTKDQLPTGARLTTA